MGRSAYLVSAPVLTAYTESAFTKLSVLGKQINGRWRAAQPSRTHYGLSDSAGGNSTETQQSSRPSPAQRTRKQCLESVFIHKAMDGRVI